MDVIIAHKASRVMILFIKSVLSHFILVCTFIYDDITHSYLILSLVYSIVIFYINDNNNKKWLNIFNMCRYINIGAV